MIHVQSVPAGYGFGYCGDVISFPPLAWPINLEQSSEKELFHELAFRHKNINKLL